MAEEGKTGNWWSRRGKFSKVAIIILVAIVAAVPLSCGEDEGASEPGSTEPTTAEEAGTGESSVSETEPNEEQATTTTEPKAASPETFTRDNWDVLNTDPEEYKGARVDIVGRVFTDVERDADGTYWQMYSDPQNSEWNTIVAYPDPELAIARDDYVHVEGEVFDVFEGENAFGAMIRAPAIRADSAEVVDATAAASPPVRTFDTASPQAQHSLEVTLQKVQYAADETRVYLEVFNQSNQEASFYSFNAKAVQGNTQFEPESFHDYPDLQSDLLPGIKTEGVVVFPPMDPNAGAKFIFEGSLSDYSLDFEPYIFDVPAG